MNKLAYLSGYMEKIAAAPEYRVSESQQSCSSCKYFNDQGFCGLYNFQAKPDYVCDSWESDTLEDAAD